MLESKTTTRLMREVKDTIDYYMNLHGVEIKNTQILDRLKIYKNMHKITILPDFDPATGKFQFRVNWTTNRYKYLNGKEHQYFSIYRLCDDFIEALQSEETDK